MSLVGDLLSQISNTSTFLISQREVGLDETVIVQTMTAIAESISMQISCIQHFTMSDAAALNSALAVSAFSAEQKAKVGTAIATKTVTATSSQTQKGPSTTQNLTSVTFYFTCNDHAMLADRRRTLVQLVQIIAQRCAKLRLVSPNEATVKHLAALVACYHWTADDPPTPVQSYNLVLELKQAIGAARQQGGNKAFQLPQFPPNPDMLSTEMYHAAYPDEADPPSPVVLDNFQVMLSKIICRSSSKALAGIRKPDHASASASARAPSMVNPVELVAQALLSLGMQPQGYTRGQTGEVPVILTPPSSQQRQSPSFQSLPSCSSLGGILRDLLDATIVFFANSVQQPQKVSKQPRLTTSIQAELSFN
eukprot:308148-Amphidinium_carterae.2